MPRWLLPLVGALLLAAGCTVQATPETAVQPPQSAAPADAGGAPTSAPAPVNAVTPSAPLADDTVLAGAAAIADEGRRALLDLAAAPDPILAAGGAARRVEAALAALDRLTAAAAAAPALTGHRAFLTDVLALLQATAALDDAGLATAAARLERSEAGALAGPRAAAAVGKALEALRQRYAAEPVRRNTVYLTVEGVSPANLESLLGQLAAEKARALFFLPAAVAPDPTVVKAIAENGHSLGLLLEAGAPQSPAALQQALERAARAVQAASGQLPRVVRLQGEGPWRRAHMYALESAGFVVLQATTALEPGSAASIPPPRENPVVVTLRLAGPMPGGALSAVLQWCRSHRYMAAPVPAQPPGVWPAGAALLR